MYTYTNVANQHKEIRLKHHLGNTLSSFAAKKEQVEAPEKEAKDRHEKAWEGE